MRELFVIKGIALNIKKKTNFILRCSDAAILDILEPNLG